MTEERILMRKRTTVVMLAIGCWLALSAAVAYGAEQAAGSSLAESGHSHLALFLGGGKEKVADHRESAGAKRNTEERRNR